MDVSNPAEPPPPTALVADEELQLPDVTPVEPVVIGEVCALHPPIRKAWILSGMITTTLLTSAAFVAEYFLLRPRGWYPLMTGTATAMVGGVLMLITFNMPRYWYRAWRYSIREHDVVMEHGVLWRVIRSVPRLRIQHVDISRDPLDRILGLATVTLYTAGSGGEAASIPGLTPERAEALREELLIRVDAAEARPEIATDAAPSGDDPAPGTGTGIDSEPSTGAPEPPLG
jgi:membrane protein YdbS with pleckstrin-like domain